MCSPHGLQRCSPFACLPHCLSDKDISIPLPPSPSPISLPRIQAFVSQTNMPEIYPFSPSFPLLPLTHFTPICSFFNRLSGELAAAREAAAAAASSAEAERAGREALAAHAEGLQRRAEVAENRVQVGQLTAGMPLGLSVCKGWVVEPSRLLAAYLPASHRVYRQNISWRLWMFGCRHIRHVSLDQSQ